MRRLEASANHSSEKERTFPPKAADIKSENKSVRVLWDTPHHVKGLDEGWGPESIRTRSASTAKQKSLYPGLSNQAQANQCLNSPTLSEI